MFQFCTYNLVVCFPCLLEIDSEYFIIYRASLFNYLIMRATSGKFPEFFLKAGMPDFILFFFCTSSTSGELNTLFSETLLDLNLGSDRFTFLAKLDLKVNGVVEVAVESERLA